MDKLKKETTSLRQSQRRRTEYKYMAVPRHVWAERWHPCVIGRDAPFAGAYRVNTTLPLGLWREETTSGKTEKGRKEEGKKGKRKRKTIKEKKKE